MIEPIIDKKSPMNTNKLLHGNLSELIDVMGFRATLDDLNMYQKLSLR